MWNAFRGIYEAGSNSVKWSYGRSYHKTTGLHRDCCHRCEFVYRQHLSGRRQENELLVFSFPLILAGKRCVTSQYYNWFYFLLVVPLLRWPGTLPLICAKGCLSCSLQQRSSFLNVYTFKPSRLCLTYRPLVCSIESIVILAQLSHIHWRWCL